MIVHHPDMRYTLVYGYFYRGIFYILAGLVFLFAIIPDITLFVIIFSVSVFALAVFMIVKAIRIIINKKGGGQ